jgi:hypothetical protein
VDGPLSIQPQLATVLDHNADGRLDLVIADNNGSFMVHGIGDGTFGAPIAMPGFFGAAAGDLNEDGHPDLVTVADVVATGTIFLNQEGGAGGVLARAFPFAGKAMVLNEVGADACVRVEPVGSSYANSDVDYSSLRLKSEGTGAVSIIPAALPKSVSEGDTDRNGVGELPVCFTRSDLKDLFESIRGRSTVTARLQGSLIDGRPFCSPIQLEVVGTGAPLSASVSPNPFNPRATLRFTTSRDGMVKIRMYDLQGRVVRTLLERPMLPAGSHEIEIDGRSRSGRTLASGIYFYEVEVAEGTVRGRLTILK